jgi:hypothetical protein
MTGSDTMIDCKGEREQRIIPLEKNVFTMNVRVLK